MSPEKETTTEKAPLPQYYRAESHGDKWHLFCKGCNKTWELSKSSQRVANALYLLNHALSHEK